MLSLAGIVVAGDASAEADDPTTPLLSPPSDDDRVVVVVVVVGSGDCPRLVVGDDARVDEVGGVRAVVNRMHCSQVQLRVVE